MKPIFVIIVTYNGAKWIDHCLSSVYESTVETKTIVLDNGSTDQTLDIINEKFPQCQLIETGRNLGFGRANNWGIREAIMHGAEYIYLLNQDAWVAPDCFEQIIRVHKNNQEYGILAPLQFTGAGDKYDWYFHRDTIQGTKNNEIIKEFDSFSFKSEVHSVSFTNAAHWCLPTKALLQVGAFSEAFPHYGEDTNLAQRYLYHGYKIGIVTKAKACHDREYRETSPQKKVYMQYINTLKHLHNPLITSSWIRYKYLVNISYRIFVKIKGAKLSDRLKYIMSSYKAAFELKPYMKKYKQLNNNIGLE